MAGDVREQTEGCPWLISSHPPCLPSGARAGWLLLPPWCCWCECLERGEGALQSRCRCPALSPQGAQGCWPEETGG